MTKKIYIDFFFKGLSIVGIARKYGKTVNQIQDILRKELIKRDKKNTK